MPSATRCPRPTCSPHQALSAAASAVRVRISGGVVAAPHAGPDTGYALVDGDAPWGEFVAPGLSFCLRSDALRAADTAGTLAEAGAFWGSALAAHHALAPPPYGVRSERVVPDVQAGAGLMHSGYPVVVDDTAFASCSVQALSRGVTDAAALRSPDGLCALWGLLHEFGHNMQRSSWTWSAATEVRGRDCRDIRPLPLACASRALSMTSCLRVSPTVIFILPARLAHAYNHAPPQVTCNLFTLHALDRAAGVPLPAALSTWNATAGAELDAALADPSPSPLLPGSSEAADAYARWESDPAHALVTFAAYVQRHGWEALRTTLAAIDAGPAPSPPAESPLTAEAQCAIDSWALAASAAAGADAGALFASHGLPVSAEVRAVTAGTVAAA